MKTSIIASSLGVLALLGSSVGSAATVTVTSDKLNPLVGETFILTVSATDFVNIGGGTVAWSWDTSKATIQHLLTNTACTACLPLSGPLSTAGNIIQLRPANWDVLPNAPPLAGNFDIARFSFVADAPGALNFVLSDDGGVSTGWFDNDTAEPTATSYAAAVNVQVSEIPAPAAVWLLGTGIAGLVVHRVRRSRAAA